MFRRSPSPPPPIAVNPWTVLVAITAAGAITDFPNETRSYLQSAVAQLADVPPSAVWLSLEPGSVRIRFFITLASAIEADVAEASLRQAFASPADATAALMSASAGNPFLNITIVAIDTHPHVFLPPAQPPSPSAVMVPAPQTQQPPSATPLPLVVTITIASSAATLVVVLLGTRWRRSLKKRQWRAALSRDRALEFSPAWSAVSSHSDSPSRDTRRRPLSTSGTVQGVGKALDDRLTAVATAAAAAAAEAAVTRVIAQQLQSSNATSLPFRPWPPQAMDDRLADYSLYPPPLTQSGAIELGICPPWQNTAMAMEAPATGTCRTLSSIAHAEALRLPVASLTPSFHLPLTHRTLSLAKEPSPHRCEARARQPAHGIATDCTDGRLEARDLATYGNMQDEAKSRPPARLRRTAEEIKAGLQEQRRSFNTVEPTASAPVKFDVLAQDMQSHTSAMQFNGIQTPVSSAERIVPRLQIASCCESPLNTEREERDAHVANSGEIEPSTATSRRANGPNSLAIAVVRRTGEQRRHDAEEIRRLQDEKSALEARAVIAEAAARVAQEADQCHPMGLSKRVEDASFLHSRVSAAKAGVPRLAIGCEPSYASPNGICSVATPPEVLTWRPQPSPGRTPTRPQAVTQSCLPNAPTTEGLVQNL